MSADDVIEAMVEAINAAYCQGYADAVADERGVEVAKFDTTAMGDGLANYDALHRAQETLRAADAPCSPPRRRREAQMHDPSWTREELAHLREAARVATDPIIARALRLALRHLPSEADCAWGEQAAAEVAAAIDDAVQEVKEYREANPHLRPADFQDYEEWKAKMLRSPERGE